jgi:hypothetical protein
MHNLAMIDPDSVCPFCKLEWAECACEEPDEGGADAYTSDEAESMLDARCRECGKTLLDCDCDVKILEEEA